MSTSNSYDFSLTAAQIMQTAAEDLGVLRPGQTMPAAMSTFMLRRLNMLAKQWQGTADGMPGLPIFSRKEVTLFLAAGQHVYYVAPLSQQSHATSWYGRTTIDAAEAAGQTILSVTATSDTTTQPGYSITAAATNIIGIEQDDGTIFWTTVSSIAPGDTITVTDALTASASVGNYVWYYDTAYAAQHFPHLETAMLRDEHYNDSPMKIYNTIEDYNYGVASKYASGTPTALMVEPFTASTRITLNAQPTDVTDTIVMSVLYPSEDYDAVTNDIAFPQEAYAALSWELAMRCASGLQAKWSPVMQAAHQSAVSKYMNLNPEYSNQYFQPNA